MQGFTRSARVILPDGNRYRKVRVHYRCRIPQLRVANCVTFNDAVLTNYAASTGGLTKRMITRYVNDAVIAQSEVLSEHFPGRTGKTFENYVRG